MIGAKYLIVYAMASESQNLFRKRNGPYGLRFPSFCSKHAHTTRYSENLFRCLGDRNK